MLTIETSNYVINTMWLLHPNYTNLVQNLKEKKYSCPELRPGFLPESGILAKKGTQKGEVFITVEPQRRVLGIEGISIKDVTRYFNEIMDLLSSYGDIEKNVIIHELIGNITIRSNNNPLEKIGNIFGEPKLFTQFNNALDEDLQLFSIKVVPKGKTPIETEWFELTIEPYEPQSNTHYHLRVVYRNPARTNVTSFTEDFEDRVLTLINKIEE